MKQKQKQTNKHKQTQDFGSYCLCCLDWNCLLVDYGYHAMTESNITGTSLS